MPPPSFQAHEALSDCAASPQAWAPAAKGDVEASIQHICPLWREAVLIRTQNSRVGILQMWKEISVLIQLFTILFPYWASWFIYLNLLKFYFCVSWILIGLFSKVLKHLVFFSLEVLFQSRSKVIPGLLQKVWVVVGRIMASQRCPHPNLWNQRNYFAWPKGFY